jgi:aspartate dehydrogenase
MWEGGCCVKTISIIGYGQIGSAMVRGLAKLASCRLGRILTRHPLPDLATQTQDVDAFLSHPADLIIDTAGPEALRTLGPRALACAPVWSVGAVAMAEPLFRARVASVSQQSGNHLRLFACGMSNMPLSATRMQITMRAGEIEEHWRGPLSHAVSRWPDRLNTAVAAALNGPGLEATELVMEPGSPDAAHQIDLVAEADGISWQRSIRFDLHPDAPHPVAQMMLAELACAERFWQGI